MSRVLLIICVTLWTALPVGAEVLRVTDLNAAQIRALDRSKTVVVLTGGMLEGTAHTFRHTPTGS